MKSYILIGILLCLLKNTIQLNEGRVEISGYLRYDDLKEERMVNTSVSDPNQQNMNVTIRSFFLNKQLGGDYIIPKMDKNNPQELKFTIAIPIKKFPEIKELSMKINKKRPCFSKALKKKEMPPKCIFISKMYKPTFKRSETYADFYELSVDVNLKELTTKKSADHKYSLDFCDQKKSKSYQ
uniref:Arrestin_N domain-containing protein n=1 Tax=Parastrongyloides trichosuri TaxID=131310 RepID=A0A0N5A2S2_PARTI